MSKQAEPAPNAVEQQSIQDTSAVPADAGEERDEQSAVSEYSQEAGDKASMHIKVYSPFEDYYDGQAFSLTAENATGPFDVLPQHHNFISLLTECELIIRTVSKGEQKVRISGGLIHIKNDSAIVFLDV